MCVCENTHTLARHILYFLCPVFPYVPLPSGHIIGLRPGLEAGQVFASSIRLTSPLPPPPPWLPQELANNLCTMYHGFAIPNLNYTVIEPVFADVEENAQTTFEISTLLFFRKLTKNIFFSFQSFFIAALNISRIH